MRLGKLDHRLVAETFRLQTVCLALQCGGPSHRGAGWQQHRQRDDHGPLVVDQVIVRAGVIVSVLMNVDDRRGGTGGAVSRVQAPREEQRRGSANKLAARHAQWTMSVQNVIVE